MSDIVLGVQKLGQRVGAVHRSSEAFQGECTTVEDPLR